MNIDAVTVRPMQPEELDDVANLRAVGFGGEADQAKTRLQETPRYDFSHIFVAEHNGQVVGTATIFPVQMWLSGVPLRLGAVAGVAVLPEFRNKGIAAKLMNFSILDMHTQGHALTALYPFSHSYYHRFNYAAISDLHVYHISPDNIDITGDVEKVRPFEEDDLPMLRATYKGQLTWHNGWFTRSNEWWDKIIERWPNFMVFDNDGWIEGYFSYFYSTDKDGNKVMSIKEFFAAEPEAYQAMMGYLARQKLVDIIEIQAPADTPLRHSLKEPVAFNAQNRGWIFNDLCHVVAGPMGRIIDLPKALTTRFYTRGMSGERVFKVTDPIIAANQDPIVFRLVDGRAETRPANGEAVQVETDIATLTQVVCGYMKAKDARMLGKFRTDEDTASWLDQIIVDTPLNIQGGDWF